MFFINNETEIINHLNVTNATLFTTDNILPKLVAKRFQSSFTCEKNFGNIMNILMIKISQLPEVYLEP